MATTSAPDGIEIAAVAPDSSSAPLTQSVVLVGFMGAGKSAVGRELATALALPFVDSDELVVAEAGRSITALFAERGETDFRVLEESIVLRELGRAARRACVLALGGGAVRSDLVRRALRGVPKVVWLTAPADELWTRVGRDAGEAPERPLAADRESFGRLLAVREPLYQEVATLIAETAGRSPAAVAHALAADWQDGPR